MCRGDRRDELSASGGTVGEGLDEDDSMGGGGGEGGKEMSVAVGQCYVIYRAKLQVRFPTPGPERDRKLTFLSRGDGCSSRSPLGRDKPSIGPQTPFGAGETGDWLELMAALTGRA